ncbi:hypothetical protein F2Q70_00012942 [Brassica cretica]|uniref:Uncharacterized protein n=1 Tax=Brassica cretica TaxID=69181 RepID=A0A8S9M2M4_BRACR|nr:hypothetical protein F2Q70_00012942 [Brassica cretica]
MTRTTGDLPKKFGAPKKGLIDGGDASTSNNKNGQAQAKKKVDKERMWLLRLRILIIVRAELRGRHFIEHLPGNEMSRVLNQNGQLKLSIKIPQSSKETH